MPDSDVITV